MKKRFIRNKKVRYATITATLTIMVILVAVLSNVVLSSLVERYELYTSLTPVLAFDVTEDCYSILDSTFQSRLQNDGKLPQIEILFCNLEDAVKAEGSENYYLYHTAVALAERFDNIKLTFHDIYVNPTPVKPYTTTQNPLTGEDVEVKLNSTNVIVVSEGYHRVYNWTDFYVFEDEESTTPWAYSGERKLSSALMHAVDEEPRLACLLTNHGEVSYDYELLTILDDAGYTVVYLDLYKLYQDGESIPTNCDLIISYNPNTDLVADELSQISEKAILDDFLAQEGHSFFLFLENGTPSMPNFESYIKEWGIQTEYAQNATTGVSYRYMVQDTSASLTSDGYTIYGYAADAKNDRFVNSENEYVIFGNATALSVVGEGYSAQQDGTYVSMSGTRTLYPLYKSGEKTLHWANGQVVDGGPRILMSLTEQKNATGSSYVGVVSSVNFGTRAYLQSAVYDNGDVLLTLFEEIGGRTTPTGLTIKPFASYDISTVTTAQMLRWTIVLVLIPTVSVLAVATVVLIKRRRA
ncbi:MAG: Gldg family protein [Clostridia bacterium]|nr:Gldg family protein [Clostridia bacterium]